MRLDLPSWDTLEPYQPVTGRVAVSFTMLKTYGWLVARQQGRSEPAFAWLDRYQPVVRVEKSILLYHIPANVSGYRAGGVTAQTVSGSPTFFMRLTNRGSERTESSTGSATRKTNGSVSGSPDVPPGAL